MLPNSSLPFDCISVCHCCEAENTNPNRSPCSHCNSTQFLQNKVFHNGRCLCLSGKNPDCVYRDQNKVIVIEIKNRKINELNKPNQNGKTDNEGIAGKIKNSYDCANANGLLLKVFVLQLSSAKNNYIKIKKYLSDFKIALGVCKLYYQDIGGKIHIREKKTNKLLTIFDVKRCSDLNDVYFNNILQ